MTKRLWKAELKPRIESVLVARIGVIDLIGRTAAGPGPGLVRVSPCRRRRTRPCLALSGPWPCVWSWWRDGNQEPAQPLTTTINELLSKTVDHGDF